MQMRYVLVLSLLCGSCFGPSAKAQSQTTTSESVHAESSRRILQKTLPTYPAVAKKINLGGTVKVVAVVAADGDVKAVESKGGSPILIQAAEDALAKWKFASGSESRETIEFRFSP